MSDLISKKELRHICNYTKDGNLVWKNPTNKRRTKVGSVIGAKDKATGYIYATIQGKKYRLHRLVFFYHHGYFPEFVDHINRNKIDNRIENLRACTRSQNHMNVGKKYNNTSGYKNVRSFKGRSDYGVSIRHNGKCHYKSGFKTPEDANRYAIGKRAELHGDFANHDQEVALL